MLGMHVLYITLINLVWMEHRPKEILKNETHSLCMCAVSGKNRTRCGNHPWFQPSNRPSLHPDFIVFIVATCWVMTEIALKGKFKILDSILILSYSIQTLYESIKSVSDLIVSGTASGFVFWLHHRSLIWDQSWLPGFYFWERVVLLLSGSVVVNYLALQWYCIIPYST